MVSAGGNYLPGGSISGHGGSSAGTSYSINQAHHGGVSHVSRTFGPTASYGGGYGYGGNSGNVWGAGTPSSYEYTVHHGSSNSHRNYGSGASGWAASPASGSGYGAGASSAWTGGYSGWQ